MMNFLKYITALTLFAGCFSPVLAQKTGGKNMINKSAEQLMTLVDEGTDADSVYVVDTIGLHLKNLMDANILRGGYAAEEFGTISGAISQAETDTFAVLLSTQKSLTARDTLRAGGVMVIYRGGIIDNSSAKLFIAGTITADYKQKIFTDPDSVEFLAGAVNKVSPYWFNDTNLRTGFIKAATAVQGNAIIHIPPGRHTIDSSIVFFNIDNLTISGDGDKSILVRADTLQKTAYGSGFAPALLNFDGCDSLTLSDFVIDADKDTVQYEELGLGSKSSGGMILVQKDLLGSGTTSSNHIRVSRVRVRDIVERSYGFLFEFCRDVVVDNCEVYEDSARTQTVDSAKGSDGFIFRSNRNVTGNHIVTNVGKFGVRMGSFDPEFAGNYTFNGGHHEVYVGPISASISSAYEISVTGNVLENIFINDAKVFGRPSKSPNTGGYTSFHMNAVWVEAVDSAQVRNIFINNLQSDSLTQHIRISSGGDVYENIVIDGFLMTNTLAHAESGAIMVLDSVSTVNPNPIKNLIIRNGVIRKTLGHGIALLAGADVLIENVKADSVAKTAFYLRKADPVTLRNVVAANCGYDSENADSTNAGIWASESDSVRIFGFTTIDPNTQMLHAISIPTFTANYSTFQDLQIDNHPSHPDVEVRNAGNAAQLFSMPLRLSSQQGQYAEESVFLGVQTANFNVDSWPAAYNLIWLSQSATTPDTLWVCRVGQNAKYIKLIDSGSSH